MKFQWPGALFLLVLIPLMIAIYLWLRKRRPRYAIRYSSLSLVRAAIPSQSRLRQYLPPALFFLAFSSLVFGLARPVVITRIPAGRATVMLAMDVSLSMRQSDILPNRLQAAKQAALTFIDRQKATNQVGVVAFAGIAQLAQSPTTDTEALEKAILQLSLGRGTAIGSGILSSLNAINEFSQDTTPAPQNPNPGAPAIPVTGYAPDIIVLLTDGVNNTGPDPLEAAQQAASRHVRIYTISYGTDQGGDMQGGTFDYWGYHFRQGVDVETLQKIAAMTGGTYYSASSASQLQKVFDSLPTILLTRQQTTEISVTFAALAAFLVIGAVILGQLWRPLP